MWLIIPFCILLIFSSVLLFGAPYLPTLKKQRTLALDLLDLKPGQTLLELGCGDGRMLAEAAKRGINSVGYEINPVLFIVAKIVNLHHRHQVKIKFRNFWKADWPIADGIYVFSLKKYMADLDKKIIKYNKGVKFVSYAFCIPGKKPKKEQSGLFLYIY